MNRNQAKQFYPILQAFAEGRVIECRTKPSFIEGSDVPNDWTEMKEIEFWNNTEYRVKPEQKYRPFMDAKECWQEMQKHQPFGWVKSTLFKDLALVKRVTTLYVEINRDIIDYKDALEKFTFADDTNFGVKVEEQRMILYQIWCKRTYVSGGFCEGEDEPTQLIFTTLDKARSKIPKDHYSKENGSREYYIKKIEIE